jgi:hypothetical protein
LCWRLGGVIGIDPRPFSLRELWRMFRGRQDHDLDMQATLLVELFNAWRSEDDDPILWDDVRGRYVQGEQWKKKEVAQEEQEELLSMDDVLTAIRAGVVG